MQKSSFVFAKCGILVVSGVVIIQRFCTRFNGGVDSKRRSEVRIRDAPAWASDDVQLHREPFAFCYQCSTRICR